MREPRGLSSSTNAAEAPHAGIGPSVSGTRSQIGTCFFGASAASLAAGLPAGLPAAGLPAGLARAGVSSS